MKAPTSREMAVKIEKLAAASRACSAAAVVKSAGVVVATAAAPARRVPSVNRGGHNYRG
jgi:hypothetical protein